MTTMDSILMETSRLIIVFQLKVVHCYKDFWTNQWLETRNPQTNKRNCEQYITNGRILIYGCSQGNIKAVQPIRTKVEFQTTKATIKIAAQLVWPMETGIMIYDAVIYIFMIMKCNVL